MSPAASADGIGAGIPDAGVTAPRRTALIMAGGTGGHVFPGLAVAGELRARAWNIVWLGNPSGMEQRLVPAHDIPLVPVQISGVRGKGWRSRLALPWQLARALGQALAAVRRVRPAVVLGMGGYVAFPGGVAAALLRRPLVVHEQNSVAGLTNRVLARLASRVLVAFPDALPRARWVGNPVRASLAALPSPQERMGTRTGPLRLLVVGGSLGAQALNTVVPQALAMMSPQSRPMVTHQSGRAHLDALRAAYATVGVQADVVDFIEDMALAYGNADLVLCRSGAMTVAEVAAAGVASIFVPFPHAVDDHQTTNARYLVERGAALLMPQTELTADSLAALLASRERQDLIEMAQRARAAARPDATRAVADACEEVALAAEAA